MAKKKIFLAVLEDRHIDNQYEASPTVERAIQTCKKWIKEYGDRYQFRKEEIRGWEYSRNAGDDCPKMHVEKINLNE